MTHSILYDYMMLHDISWFLKRSIPFSTGEISTFLVAFCQLSGSCDLWSHQGHTYYNLLQQWQIVTVHNRHNTNWRSDALTEAELPTRGSAGHGLGACKPCAFFYKERQTPTSPSSPDPLPWAFINFHQLSSTFINFHQNATWLSC